MSGIMEILLIVAIILAIFMLPRLMARKPERVFQAQKRVFRLTGRLRFAIVASFVWPAAVAFFLKPWNSHWFVFLYVGVGPVALIWAIYWIFWGFKEERR